MCVFVRHISSFDCWIMIAGSIEVIRYNDAELSFIPVGGVMLRWTICHRIVQLGQVGLRECKDLGAKKMFSSKVGYLRECVVPAEGDEAWSWRKNTARRGCGGLSRLPLPSDMPRLPLLIRWTDTIDMTVRTSVFVRCSSECSQLLVTTYNLTLNQLFCFSLVKLRAFEHLKVDVNDCKPDKIIVPEAHSF